MDYSKFQLLVREGEKPNVDFKIQCDAFGSKKLSSKAELAKDICAMANNGNIASYIIIGVSDDRQQFNSVANSKLTDDALQDFCKKAIFPPPKVKLYRKRWRNASPAHRGKEFVIIQVGPQARQVFRLAQDFVDYGERVCHRRNEVWIRRGATSDLATPEEICRLASGQPLQDDENDKQRQAARASFARASQVEQENNITASTTPSLQKIGYAKLPQRDWLETQLYYGNIIRTPTLWKKVGTSAILVYVLGCSPGLTEQTLRRFDSQGYFDWHFAEWDRLPAAIADLTRRSVKTVRRVWFKPIIGSVPTSRIVKIFPTLRRVGSFSHYYRTDLKDWRHKQPDQRILMPSSTELLILDKIKSVPDFVESLTQAIGEIEREESTIITPTNE